MGRSLAAGAHRESDASHNDGSRVQAAIDGANRKGWRHGYNFGMDAAAANTVRIGDRYADPLRSTLTKASEVVRVDARCMRLLMCLGGQAGQVMSIEKLLD
jgi:DNA-binding response OmpR family regulator